jgi:hypothetical protein
MRRSLLSILALATLVAAPTAAEARGNWKLGMSEQNAHMFVEPSFAALKTTMARYVVPWDVLTARGRQVDKENVDNWIKTAQKANQDILIAFETSRKTPRKAPTVKQYTRAIRRFQKTYPSIHNIQAWNEVNRCPDTNEAGYVVGQPTCRKPKLAALYYMAARRVFKGAKITGVDILDARDISCKRMDCALKYLRTFMKYAKPRPKYWGLHNYADTNRFSMKRTKAILKVTRRGDVWLTETGGIVSLGKNFPYNPKRAAKALGCMFSLANSNPRITRLYVYEYFGQKKSKLFDAGLLNPNFSKRPGYEIVRKRKARRCHR